jgi:PHP family Zn ribbon phosphoesterase
LSAAARINARLPQSANIVSDGRPILGLDSRDLWKSCLKTLRAVFWCCAHLDPWFSMLGSKSGFDSVEECFGNLSEHIFALETGLSSDPEMNRLVSSLDKYALISNSDCHSPASWGARPTSLTQTSIIMHLLQRCGRTGATVSWHS